MLICVFVLTHYIPLKFDKYSKGLNIKSCMKHSKNYANVSQLVCLSNLENLNAVFINKGMSQAERLAKLNAIAISQMEILTQDHRIEALEAHSGELSPIE